MTAASQGRVVRFSAPRTVEIATVDVPSLDAGDVLVRTRWSGISGGTELLAYRGEVPPDLPLDEALGSLAGTFSFPFSYGYSCAGVVEAGALPRGTSVFAFHPHQDRFVVPASEAIDIGGVEPREATLYPLVETALQISLDAALAAGPLAEQAVAVLGLGAVGLLSGLLLQRAGATVIGCDPIGDRRSLAERVGLASTVEPDALGEIVRERTHGRGLPLVVEASGNPVALAATFPVLAHEGTALVASWYGAKEAVLPLGREFHRRRLAIRSTQVTSIPAALAGTWTRERRRTVARRLLEELPLKLLATHAFAFERAADAYAALDRGEPGVVHAALSYA